MSLPLPPGRALLFVRTAWRVWTPTLMDISLTVAWQLHRYLAKAHMRKVSDAVTGRPANVGKG